MPRFFFDVVEDGYAVDFEGVELADIKTARLEATRLAGSLLVHRPELVWGNDDWRLVVRDERNQQVLSLTFSGDTTIRGAAISHFISGGVRFGS